MQEIEAAQEQIKSQALASSPATVTPTTGVQGDISSTSQSSAPQWAVDLVNKLTTIDSAAKIVNLSVSGKSTENTHDSEVNRMIKILSIASGKTTAEQEAEAGDIPYSQYIREKEAAAKKENTAENGGEVEVSENGIYAGMSEEERYEVLKDQSVEIVEAEPLELSENDNLEYEDLVKKAKSKIEKPLIEKIKALGFIKKYKSKAIKPDFDFTMKGLRKSLHSQLKYGGDYADLTKIINNLQELLDKAVLIETHTDKAVGTDRENPQLKQVYVMVSVFADKDGIIPVQFEVQQMIDEANRLYLAVALTKIETGVSGNTILEENQASTSLLPVSTISLHDLFQNINPQDANFLKYVPDGFLNQEQKQAKNKALEEERVKYGRDESPDEDDFDGFTEVDVSEETVAKRKKSVEKLTKLFGLGLEWSESVKRGKYNPNSRTVVLNPNLTLREMYLEVLKHEFTHDLENRKLYAKFKNFLFESSKSFIEFCEQRMKELTGETIKGRNAVYALRGEVYMAYKKSKELTQEERNAFNRESAEREMVCDFVAKKLLAAENEEAAIKALTELAENQPTIWERFTQWLKDIIFKIKHSHNKTDSKQEIEYLERLLKRVYDSKVDKKKTSNEVENKHYIEYNAAEENTHIIELLNRIKQGSFKPNELVYFKNISDNIAQKIYNETGIDVKGFKVAIEARQLEHILKDHGIQGKTDHSMSSDSDIAKIEYVLDSPNEISYSGKTQAYSSFINGYNRTADTVLYEKEIGDKSYYVVQAVPVTKKKTLFIVSAFIGEKGYKKETLRLNNAKSPVATSQYDSAKVSNNSVSQNDTTVNSNSMQDIENHSIDMESEAKSGIISFPDRMKAIDESYRNGELSEEEYRVEVQGLLMRANEKYGTIEPGEKAENKTSIPKRVTSNKSEKTKRWVRTVHESGILPEDMEVELEAKILKDAMSYQIIADKAAQRQANLAIERGTAVKEWEAAVNGDGRVGKREIAIGETLLKLAAERKDNRTVILLKNKHQQSFPYFVISLN